jgi:hypothetical protein
MHYRQELLIFGFGGYTQRPQPFKVLNTYIKVGQRREQSPSDNRNHSIDHKDRYHIREPIEFTKPNHYAYGFMVRTHEPGRFPVIMELSPIAERAAREISWC